MYQNFGRRYDTLSGPSKYLSWGLPSGSTRRLVVDRLLNDSVGEVDFGVTHLCSTLTVQDEFSF